MKSIIRTVISHLFVISTSVAALLHSMWVISHLLGGADPVNPTTLEFVGYWLPGLFVAVSLDIGLLSTSAALRRGVRNKPRYLALAILSASMFYLQMCYGALHQPLLPLGVGIRPEWAGLFSLIRDAGVFVIPLLMPTSILLYSFGDEPQSVTPPVQDGAAPVMRESDQTELPEPTPEPLEVSLVTVPLEIHPNGNGRAHVSIVDAN